VTAGGTFDRGEGNIKITASLGNLPYFPLRSQKSSEKEVKSSCFYSVL